MQWSLFRVLGVLIAVYIAWALLTDFAGTLFLLCMAVAAWRLWRTAMVGRGKVSLVPAGRLLRHPVARTGTTTPLPLLWRLSRARRASWSMP